MAKKFTVKTIKCDLITLPKNTKNKRPNRNGIFTGGGGTQKAV